MFAHLKRLLFVEVMGPRRVAGGFYAVRSGRRVGVVHSWAECEQLVKGFPGAKFKKFSTASEAERFVAGEEEESASEIPSQSSLLNSLKRTLPHVKEKRHSVSLKTKYKKRISPVKVSSEKTATGEELPVVYTDGACSMNGTEKAKAGIGVYWGDGDIRNVSRKLQGRPTNNRAEIHAAIAAIRQAKAHGLQKLEIRTDSNFLIKAITEWVPLWKSRGWTLTSGKPVVNREDFTELLEAQKDLEIVWTHVRGHVGIHGNEMADRLAVEGMNKVTEGNSLPFS